MHWKFRCSGTVCIEPLGETTDRLPLCRRHKARLVEPLKWHQAASIMGLATVNWPHATPFIKRLALQNKFLHTIAQTVSHKPRTDKELF
jgi:hypothetical protein